MMNQSQDRFPSDTTFSAAIFQEQIRLLYRHTVPLLLINLLVGSALLYGFWPIASPAIVLAWGILVLCITAVRFILYRAYQSGSLKLDTHGWARVFVVTCAVQGVVWGSTALLFFQPGALEYQLLIFFVLAGMGAGSVASLCAYRPAFFAYFLLSMLPILLRLMMEATRFHAVLSILCLAFIVGMCFFALQINCSFLVALRFRFENASLVEKLRQQKEEADRANQAKSKFLAAASHDLRQPLHALTLFTSLLTDDLDAHQRKKLTAQINRSVDALQTLFNALLDISRLEAGTLVPEVRHFRVRPMLERITNDFAVDAQKKHLVLRIDTDSELVAKTDPCLLEQILRNYLSNAIRYTLEGHVVLSALALNGQVIFKVNDTGLGIATDQLDEIYEEFHQLHNPERDRSKGLGLGLAIVKRIAALLNHPIEVQSALGEGSCFSIRVPEGAPSNLDEKPTAKLQWANNPTGERATVAIIDDDLEVREAMRALFESWSCRAITAASINESLETLREGDIVPDAVIADYRLRDGRTGIGAIETLRAEFGADLPALIITGDTALEQLQALQKSGIPVVNKPVSPGKLRAFLNNIHYQDAVMQPQVKRSD